MLMRNKTAFGLTCRKNIEKAFNVLIDKENMLVATEVLLRALVTRSI